MLRNSDLLFQNSCQIKMTFSTAILLWQLDVSSGTILKLLNSDAYGRLLRRAAVTCNSAFCTTESPANSKNPAHLSRTSKAGW